MYFLRRRSLTTMVTTALLLSVALPSMAGDDASIIADEVSVAVAEATVVADEATAVADEATIAAADEATGTVVEATVVADEAPAVPELTQVEVVTPDYKQMKTFMERVSVNQRGRPAIKYKQVRELNLSFFQTYEDYLVNMDSDSLSADDRLAYWLNLQNFLVVTAVTFDTKKTNLKSLRGTGTKPGKLWTKDRVTIGDEIYSIADIEAKIVSENKNPNVIYGLYQGVKGGPCLSSTPYEGATVNARLAELGEQYVNSRGIVEPNKSVVTLTPIYEWHKTALFADNDKEVFTHVKNHSSTHLRGRLNRATEVKYTKLNYTTDDFVPEKLSQRKRSSPSRPVPTQRPPSGGGYGS